MSSAKSSKLTPNELLNKIFDGLVERKIISSVLILDEPLSICINSWKDAYESGSWGITYEKATIIKVDGRNPRLLISVKGWGHGRGSPEINKIIGFLDLGELSGIISSKMKDEARVKVLSPIISSKLSENKKNVEDQGLWGTSRFCAGLEWLFLIDENNGFRMRGRDISRFQSAGKWSELTAPYVVEQIDRDLRDRVI